MDGYNPRRIALLIPVLIIFSVLLALIYDSDPPHPEVYDSENELWYQTTEAQLLAEGSQLDLYPKKTLNGADWSVEPRLPKGMALFTHDISVNGRLIDSSRNLLCVISNSMGVLCMDSIDSGGASHSDLSLSIGILYENSIADFAPTSIAVGSNHVCSIIEHPNLSP